MHAQPTAASIFWLLRLEQEASHLRRSRGQQVTPQRGQPEASNLRGTEDHSAPTPITAHPSEVHLSVIICATTGPAVFLVLVESRRTPCSQSQFLNLCGLYTEQRTAVRTGMILDCCCELLLLLYSYLYFILLVLVLLLLLFYCGRTNCYRYISTRGVASPERERLSCLVHILQRIREDTLLCSSGRRPA